jgi:hypothetical protein
MADEVWPALSGIIDNYVKMLYKELDARWEHWELDLSQREVHEVIGGLLARQVTLASELAHAPSIWNSHMAPLVLRAMTDVRINLAWILEEPKDRARKFILYGLGQAKLLLEHHKQSVPDDGASPEEDVLIKSYEEWINSQRFTFLTEVNVGSWSGFDTRKMAEEAGCLDVYRFVYTPFSACTHSMWQHVEKYNLAYCGNPLHRYHRVPATPRLHIDPHYLYLAAKYAEASFALFDEKIGADPEVASSLDYLVEQLNSLGQAEGTKAPDDNDE